MSINAISNLLKNISIKCYLGAMGHHLYSPGIYLLAVNVIRRTFTLAAHVTRCLGVTAQLLFTLYRPLRFLCHQNRNEMPHYTNLI